jgi:hypothetical protein
MKTPASLDKSIFHQQLAFHLDSIGCKLSLQRTFDLLRGVVSTGSKLSSCQRNLAMLQLVKVTGHAFWDNS